jgi:isopentenyl diphosphate isomerase/L-lactate dehydrogenase-like FMN-dependent dehydrogenase
VPAKAQLTLGDVEALARARLGAGAFDYIAGGAGDEWTLAENLAAWQRLRLTPRVLTGAPVDTSVTVLGTALPHPIIAAPTAYQRIAGADGEVATARACASTATVMCVSTLSTVSARDVAIAVPGVRRWFQVYVFADRGLTHQLIESALAFGYEALVLTVDFPVSGVRERDLRSGFVVSDVVPAVAATGMDRAFEPHTTQHIIDSTLTWKDVAAVASRYRVPLLVKGILSVADARLAFEHGAAGIVVSNHGGRQLDGAPATATVLPAIADAVAGRGDVLVDGGIRRGSDIVRALALGAKAVMIGRPLYWGLAAGGEPGAQRVLELMLAELRSALVLTGAGAVARLSRDLLR